MMIQIKSRFDARVLFELECGSLKLCVEAAVKSHADLSRANLSLADLSRADLSRANLSLADLSRADLCGANLYGANLYGANLSDANLSDANLSLADLSYANLPGADLSGADLYGANLSRADLYGANLSGADLSRADLPICILHLGGYLIKIAPDWIDIGCQHKTLDEWLTVTADEAANMDGKRAKALFTKYRGVIEATARAYMEAEKSS